MKQTWILFFTTLVVFFTSDVHGQIPYAVNGTVNITLSGCGVTKRCLQTPDGCDPAGNSTCLFASDKIDLTNNAFSFQLSGNSPGYIGVTLTQNVSQGYLVLACSNSSFYAMINTTGSLASPSSNATTATTMATTVATTAATMTATTATTTATMVIAMALGKASGNNIQCEFDLVGLNISSLLRSLDTSFYVQVVSGPLNGDGTLGDITFVHDFGLLDLANPAANLATTTSAPSTTAASNSTTAASGASRALHSEAVLFLLSVLTLSILKTV